MLPKGFKINRSAARKSGKIEHFFPGMSMLRAVKDIFRSKKLREKVFKKISVKITKKGCLYMRILHGKMLINPTHLKKASRKVLYLDILHELVHVKQMLAGKDLYDENHKYFDRPTEIEAYKFAVREARKIGMSEEEIVEYLKVEWVSDKEFGKMLKNVGVKV